VQRLLMPFTVTQRKAIVAMTNNSGTRFLVATPEVRLTASVT
jgi:hypothetical protein